LPTPTNHDDGNAKNSAISIDPGSFLSLLQAQFLTFWGFAPLPSCAGMKYIFKIKTEPTLHAAVVISIIVTSSSALATIAVSLNSPSVAIYCVTVFALIIWISLTKKKP
jgi:hypothetical protein